VAQIVKPKWRIEVPLGKWPVPAPPHLNWINHGLPVVQQDAVQSHDMAGSHRLQYRHKIPVNGNSLSLPFLHVIRLEINYAFLEIHPSPRNTDAQSKQ